jgi:hypothetical protein
VLTKRRKEQIEMRPLMLQDFFTPLSQLYCCSAEEYKMFNDFTYVISGFKDRHKKLDEDNDPKKKKKRR